MECWDELVLERLGNEINIFGTREIGLQIKGFGSAKGIAGK